MGLLPFVLAGGCAADPHPGGGGASPALDPDFASVSLSLAIAQADAKCLRATFTGNTTQVLTAAPTGSTASVLFSGLPPGSYSLLVEAFNLVCASVVATTPVSWTSDPVPVVLTAGVLTPVTVTLRRPTGSAVTVDFDTSILFSAPPVPSNGVGDLAVLGNELYISRGGEIERMPITGGAFDSTWPGVSPNRVVVDTSGIFYNTITGGVIGAFWVPPGQPQVLLSPSRFSSIMVAIPGGYVETVVTNNQVADTGTIERVMTDGTVTQLVTGFQDSSLNQPIIASDGTTVFYAFPTGGGVNGGVGNQTVVGKVPVAGGGVTTLAAFNPPTYAVDIATDGAFAYVAEKSTSPALNGIFRVPTAGGAPVQVVPVASGLPVKVLVDATNVYTLISVQDNRGICDTGVITKTPKAGGTTTQTWSRSKVCPRLLAQSPTWLFFDVGVNVNRLDK